MISSLRKCCRAMETSRNGVFQTTNAKQVGFATKIFNDSFVLKVGPFSEQTWVCVFWRFMIVYENKTGLILCLKRYLLSNQGAQESMTPSLALLMIVSGRGSECRTMAPYSPYSAMMLLRPQVFSVFLHLARRFWNQTYDKHK